MDELARNRLRTLLTVDDMVREITELLEKKGALESTYFIYTSDHGFHMGQFCLGACKRQPYENDLRVPMYMRGPGIKAGQRVEGLMGIPDIAPTILALTGVDPSPLKFDGKSVLPLLQKVEMSQKVVLDTGMNHVTFNTSTWRDAWLVEYLATEPDVKYDNFGHVVDNSNNTFRGLRLVSEGRDLAYFEFTDDYKDWDFVQPSFHELYDVKEDPYQTRNIYKQASTELKAELAKRLIEQTKCAGDSCA